MQTDWIGGTPPKEFKDIRNQRESVAEEKARLCLRIKERCNTIPQSIKAGGSIESVRQWKQARIDALRVCSSKRSSVSDLEAALNMMARFV